MPEHTTDDTDREQSDEKIPNQENYDEENCNEEN